MTGCEIHESRCSHVTVDSIDLAPETFAGTCCPLESYFEATEEVGHFEAEVVLECGVVARYTGREENSQQCADPLVGYF